MCCDACCLGNDTVKETHKIKNIGWLRAAVLGANDGIVSTASLVIGVAAAHASHGSVLVAAIAGLVSGSMSMATGEYVSVSSQSDTESAALNEERSELANDVEGEHRELAAIYVRRGLDLALARQVAGKLMSHDALGAHARDELGISEITTARPLQAAFASALSFAVGAALPLAVVAVYSGPLLAAAVAIAALVALVLLGALAARTGGAKLFPSVVRITFWSALAMAVTYGVGTLFGTAVS
jgi:vacuolar iron transporter family protein